MSEEEERSLPDNPGNPEIFDIIYSEVLRLRERFENFMDNCYSETMTKLASVEGKQYIIVALILFILGCLGLPIIF